MLSPRWRKVIRDLWSNKTRTILVVLAIAVGIFAFGSVFITQEVLVADMNTQYRSINASTIIMNVRSFDDSLVRWARRQKEVADAQGRTLYPVKLVRETGTSNLTLYAYDDYQRMSLNQITPESGVWPPGRHEILLERSSLSSIDTDIGEGITVELSSGRQYELKVGGSVHDLNAIPSNLDPQLSGYVSKKTLEWLNLPSTYNRLEILAEAEFNSLSSLEKVADELKERLERNGIVVSSVYVREAGEHWAKDTTQTFTLILSLIGFFSLLLSGFLVVNTISGLLTEQRRHIGIMKAIGGTGRQIVAVYLVLVTVYGLLSLVVALPSGMGLGYLFTMMVTEFLNIDIINFHLPARVLLMQLTAALLVPIVASTIPVLNAVKVTAQESLSNFGTAVRRRGGLFDRLLLRVRGLPRPVLLSLRNTFRRKGRLLLTLGTLTIAGALFITVVNVRASMMAWTDNVFAMWFNYEVQLSLDGNYQSRGVERRVELIPGVVSAESRTGLQVQRIKPDGTKGATFPVVGLPPGTDFIQPTLLSGRWLETGDQDAIVLSSNLVDDMPGVQVGDNIVLEVENREYEWKIIGIMYLPFDRLGYADLDYLSSVKGEPGLASSVYVRTEQKEGRYQAEMAELLETRLKESGIKVNSSMTREAIAATIAGQLDFLVAFLLAMAAMTAVIGGLGLAGMMSLNVMERTREIGVMRSIGAANSAISGIVVTEGMLIGLISWALAIPLAVPLSLLFNNLVGEAFFEQPLDFLFSPLGITGWLAIVVIISVAASLLPAYRAIKMSVRETLAYE